jgi:hypothetical protein
VRGNQRCACGAAAIYRRGLAGVCARCNQRADEAERADTPAEVALRDMAQRLELVPRAEETSEEFRRRCFAQARRLLGRGVPHETSEAAA